MNMVYKFRLIASLLCTIVVTHTDRLIHWTYVKLHTWF